MVIRALAVFDQLPPAGHRPDHQVEKDAVQGGEPRPAPAQMPAQRGMGEIPGQLLPMSQEGQAKRTKDQFLSRYRSLSER